MLSHPGSTWRRVTGPRGENVHHVFLRLPPLFRSQEFRGVMTAIIEKREPKFEGR